MKPKVLIFSGYGLNSEEETAFGFELTGANPQIIHINDVVSGIYKLDDFQILSFPGGFAYGDDTGAGNAYANKIKNHLWESISDFVRKDKLVIGICNGCQIIHNLGLVPGFSNNYNDQKIALMNNNSVRFVTRWVDLKVTSNTPWLKGIESISLPIAHGEGKFYTNTETLKKLNNNKQIALKYVLGEMSTYLDLPANPNGSLDDIAGIVDQTGKIFGLMPHPERGMLFTQLPNWQLKKEKIYRENKTLPTIGPGLQIFKNAVEYFK